MLEKNHFAVRVDVALERDIEHQYLRVGTKSKLVHPIEQAAYTVVKQLQDDSNLNYRVD